MNRRVGYRFHPTEEELIDYFLRQKINGTLGCDDIVLIDICKFEPWDLPKYAAQGSNDDEWYFFHKREPINRNTTKPRYNRSTKTGHWKPTGQVRPVKAKRNRTEIGVKKNLVFYKYAEGKKEVRTNWVIHEYEPKASPFRQADLVLCKLKEKADDRAESSACREVESSHQGPDFENLPAQLLFSQALFPHNGVNFDQTITWQPQIQIDEGISIDDLELPDDIFQSGSNGLRYQFGTTVQSDTNEMDVSFLGVQDGLNAENYLTPFTADPFGYNQDDEAAHSVHNLLNHSNSESPRGIYLEDITEMDAGDFHGMSSHFGDSNLNNGQRGQYRQMQSVQSLTETLPAPKSEVQTCYESLHLPSRYGKSAATKNLDRHEKIKSTGKSNSGSPILVEAQAGSNKNNMAAGTSKFQFRSSGLSELKERETRKPATNPFLPFKPPKEKISLKAERDQKMVTAKTTLQSTSHKDKTSSYINTETSMIYQRSVPVSVYIINVSIGLVLFVAAVRDLLILH